MVVSEEKCASNVRNVAQITLERDCNMSLMSVLVQDCMINRLETAIKKHPPLRRLTLFWPSVVHQKASGKVCEMGEFLGKLHYTSETSQTTEEPVPEIEVIHCNLFVL